ncbi:MAG: voltage-gated potassium channel, partial [bacterium]
MKSFLESLHPRHWFYRLRNHPIFQFLVVFFAFLYSAAFLMMMLEQGSKSPFNEFISSLWFSLVTVTTVGYGDMYPSSMGGRIAAVAIIFVGIGFSGVLTGAITSGLVDRNRKKTDGLVPITGLKNHVLICGWRSDMEPLIRGVIHANKGLRSRDIVLVNQMNQKDVNELRRFQSIRDFHYVSGDHTDETILIQAGLKDAQKIIVLADQKQGHDITARDTRSIMTAITAESINTKVYSCVELLNHDFGHYLQKVRVEEVIL